VWGKTPAVGEQWESVLGSKSPDRFIGRVLRRNAMKGWVYLDPAESRQGAGFFKGIQVLLCVAGVENAQEVYMSMGFFEYPRKFS
jgi:hypothetical protein